MPLARTAPWPLLIMLGTLPGMALGQGPSDRGRLAEQTVDPISELMQISFFNDVDLGVGEERESDVRLMIQPQLPLRLTEDWSMVVWSVLLLRSAPPPAPEEDRLNGFSDTVFRLLLTPTKGAPGAGGSVLRHSSPPPRAARSARAPSGWEERESSASKGGPGPAGSSCSICAPWMKPKVGRRCREASFAPSPRSRPPPA